MRDLAELNSQLFEQLDFLASSSREFDAGKRHEAKRIANAICTIVHDKHRTVSILSQLAVKDRVQFVASGCEYQLPEDPTKERFQSPPLVTISLGPDGMVYEPRLDESPQKQRSLSFDDWWVNDPIFWYRDEEQGTWVERTMSRRDLVLSITDQDGGRHFDKLLSEAAYRHMKTNHGFRETKTGHLSVMFTELVSVRQIGWELAESIRRFEETEGIKITDPNFFGEIRDSKLCFFPSRRGFYQAPGIGPLEFGREYEATIVVNHLTTGCVKLVVNATMSEAISEVGTHTSRVTAGRSLASGVFGEFTDAVIDRISIEAVPK